MSDLETRLSEALARGADDAPVVPGLATAARRRARERRRARVAGAAALVVLAVGVPAAVVGLGGDDRAGGPDAADQPTAAVPEGDGAAQRLPLGELARRDRRRSPTPGRTATRTPGARAAARPPTR